MQPNPQKEVYFSKYCDTCEYKETDEADDPCDECLATTTNTYTHRPVKYEEKETRNGNK